MGEDEVVGELQSFSVDPKGYAPLKSFRCGRGPERPEDEIHKIVREFRKGRTQATAFRVTTTAAGALVGLAAVYPGKFSNPLLAQFNGFPYIAAIAVSEPFRGETKHGQRMGDFVMIDVLADIRSRWPGKPTFALVDPDNGPSCDLFRRHKFDEVIEADRTKPEDDSFYGRRPMHDAIALILELLTPLGEDGMNADELSDKLAAASLGGEIATNARQSLRVDGKIESWKPIAADGSEDDRRWRLKPPGSA